MSRAVDRPPQFTLKDEGLSEVRHNLRTPINHILGYGEMLMEDAEDRGQDRFLPDLKQILEDGKHALAIINAALCPPGNEVGEAEIRAMRDALLLPVNEILEKIRRMEPELGSGDCAKVRIAAERLLSMAAEILEPGAAAPKQEPTAAKVSEPEILVVPIAFEVKPPQPLPAENRKPGL